MISHYLNILGIIAVLVFAWFFSYNRRAINYRLVLKALIMQLLIAVITLKTELGVKLFATVANAFSKIYIYSQEGSRFVFGSLADAVQPWGFIFAFRVLPVTIFFGALMAVLFHYRIIQRAAWPIMRILYPFLGTSAAETLCVIANSFLGQTEAPLLIRAYLPKLTRSELLTIMVAGMGTISAPLFAVYSALGIPLAYLLSASIMAIPSTILISKIILPQEEDFDTKHGLHDDVEGRQACNVFDALCEGSLSGMHLALAVGAILIAFVALIALSNGLLAGLITVLQKIIVILGFSIKMPVLTIQYLLGLLFAPVGWLMGLQGNEIMEAGQLLGLKIALNEMIAFMSMSTMHLSERAVALLSFALAGFANFSSIGIQIAGIGTLAPGQRGQLSKLGLSAVLGGTLSSLLSAFIAGLVI